MIKLSIRAEVVGEVTGFLLEDGVGGGEGEIRVMKRG
jgi:hypothetical protein